MAEDNKRKLVSKKSLMQIEWQKTIESAAIKSCDTYREHFKNAAKAFEKSGNSESESAAIFLFQIAALVFGPTPGNNETREPFRSAFRPASESFTQEDIALIGEMAGQTNDPEFKARLADIAFSYAEKRDRQFSQLAIENYILAAEEFFTRALQAKEQAVRIWNDGHTRLMRALQITQGPKHPLHSKVMAAVEKFLSYKDDAPLLEITKTLELCWFGDRLDCAVAISWAEEFSQRAAREKVWTLQRRIMAVKAGAQKQLGLTTDATKTLINAAESYQNDITEALTRVKPSKLLAAKLLDHQIEAFSRLPETKKRTEELRQLKAKYQKEGIDSEMVTQVYENKIEVDIEQTKKIVRGRPLAEALTILSKLASPPKVDEIKKDVIENLEHYVFDALAPLDVYDEEGRIVAKRGCILGANKEAQEVILIKRIYENLTMRFNLLAHGAIVPAIGQIKEEHNFTPSDIHHLLTNSPFIPPGREPLFALGIYHGLLGDFITAGHLLSPQLENAIRFQLEKRRIVTTVREKEGTERMADLNYLFKYKRAELEAIFGPDQIVEIECLLIRRFGCNLRNDISHGRLDLEQMMASGMVYLWWLTLRFCFWQWQMPEDLKGENTQKSPITNSTSEPSI